MVGEEGEAGSGVGGVVRGGAVREEEIRNKWELRSSGAKEGGARWAAVKCGENVCDGSVGTLRL